MVGEVSEVRRAKRSRGSGGPVSFPHQHGAGAWDERGRRLRRLHQKERGKYQTSGQRLPHERRTRLETYLTIVRRDVRGFSLKVMREPLRERPCKFSKPIPLITFPPSANSSANTPLRLKLICAFKASTAN